MNGTYTSSDVTGLVTVGIGFYFITLALSIFMLVCMWKLFVKAGKPGWAALIPVYNVYMEFEIVYGNGIKFLFLLIPFVNVVFAIKIMFDLAKVFGKGIGFGFLLWFFSIIGFPILAFGDAKYQGPLK
mgnify:CR=1 FL=1